MTTIELTYKEVAIEKTKKIKRLIYQVENLSDEVDKIQKAGAAEVWKMRFDGNPCFKLGKEEALVAYRGYLKGKTDELLPLLDLLDRANKALPRLVLKMQEPLLTAHYE